MTEYKVEVLGKFVFVNLSDAPQPITDQLSDTMIAFLTDVSLYLDEDISITRIPVNANWKLIPEITFDEIHVPFVHTKTLFKDRKYDPKGATIIKGNDQTQQVTADGNSDPTVSIWKAASALSFVIATAHPGIKKEAWHPQVRRYGRRNAYYDAFLFPNLHFVSADGGYSFSYEAYFPIDNNHTLIDYVFTTAIKKQKDNVFSIVHLESLKMGLSVFEEDLQMMEMVQSNVEDKPLSAMHGAYESAIIRWRDFFRRVC